MFKEVSSKVSFPKMEEDILRFWEENETFQKSLEQRKDSPEYVFYDGPPFATGLPHYGHVLTSAIKDIVPRYHTMRGHYVDRRFGWDCHGLPIEALAQEALELSGAPAIREAGIDVFNEQCRSMVQTYVQEWRKTITRLGRWVDFDNDYKTMDKDFMETIWWVFKQLWDQDRVYKAHRIMPYSWKLTTPLSNFEAGNNYKDVQDPAITVRLRVTSGPPELTAGRSTEAPWYFLAWTTTPWTLPGNLALCVGPDVQYAAVQDGDNVYVLAKDRLEAYYKSPDDYTLLKELTVAELKDWTYEPLFPYFSNQPGAFVILEDSFVTTGEGTGIVHIAPAFGEDDYRVCRAAGIEMVDYLDEECSITDALPEYEGQFCKDADKALIKHLKDEGNVVHQSTIQHSYPFCERTDTPLIYRAIDAWYVRVEDLRDEMGSHNDSVHWVPEYVGEKRFGNWLRDARDWNISRNRFWGSCLPVWVSEDGEDQICVGSIKELEDLSGVKVTDLHKHHVDKITFEKDGRTYRRTPEVLDCWFESGAMPYAQLHYPFENKERFESRFPAQFIAEGLDQTRGWFYTLMILSTALFKKPPYQNVVVNGMVLAEDGRKMSKRLKNYPDPVYVIDTYGADALRLYLISSNIVKGDDLRFSEEGVQHSLRHLLIPWWNAYSFFVTYAHIDGWEPSEGNSKSNSENLLDRWILSAMERLTSEVVEAMDQYDLQKAVRPFVQFIENLTNWYIRRSRRRFWKSSNDEDKSQAYATLYEVLLRLSKIAAPYVPFISDNIYQNLRTDGMPGSVHLCDFPTGDEARRDHALEAQMDLVMSVVSMGRVIRSEKNLKVRQPLSGLHVISHDMAMVGNLQEMEALIRDELNVKEVRFNESEGQLVELQAKPDFKKLGPRFGPKVKFVAQEIAKLPLEALETVVNGGEARISIDGEEIALSEDDLAIERIPKEGLAVASEGHLVVALETELTPELVREGLARELVNKVQNMRKSADLDVVDRIRVVYQGDAEICAAVDSEATYIQSETLAEVISHEETMGEKGEEWDINGHPCRIHIETVQAG